MSRSMVVTDKSFPHSLFSSLFQNSRWEHFAAGVTGGVAATALLHPIELLKIRFQVNDGGRVSTRPTYHGLIKATSSIYQSGGVPAFFKGSIPNVIGSGSSWGLYFFMYNGIKKHLQKGDATIALSPLSHLLTGMFAGAVTLTITNPIWVTKTRLVLQYEGQTPSVSPSSSSVARYSGMSDALVKIYRADGIRGLYKGYIPGLFGVSHGAVQFMAYEELKNRYNVYRGRKINHKMGNLEYILFSAISKLIAVSSTYPYQVIRTRLQDQHRTYNGLLDVIRQTFQQEGIAAFYKGMVPAMLRVVPACCITFVVYENFISFFNAR